MSLYRGDDYFAGKLFITGNLFCHPESQTRLSGGAVRGTLAEGASINYVSWQGGRGVSQMLMHTTLAYVVNLLTEGGGGGKKIGKILPT